MVNLARRARRKNLKEKARRELRELRAKVAGRDPHVLYQLSVQNPEAEAEMIEQFYKERRGVPPMLIREDFCGTAASACAWVRSDPNRSAIGVDIDMPTIAWGILHNRSELGEAADRMKFVCSDVLTPPEDLERVDVITAMNFSWQVFKQRSVLVDYFKTCHSGLRDDGVFILDIFGGPEAQATGEEDTDHVAFTYVWDTEMFDPVTHHTVCHIHFEFPDGSRMERAFTYDWRLWTIPEVRDALLEAGFSAVDVWWEGSMTDEDGDQVGNDEFERVDHAENEEAWVTFLVGVK